jgi:hypothetical protein
VFQSLEPGKPVIATGFFHSETEWFSAIITVRELWK